MATRIIWISNWPRGGAGIAGPKLAHGRFSDDDRAGILQFRDDGCIGRWNKTVEGGRAIGGWQVTRVQDVLNEYRNAGQRAHLPRNPELLIEPLRLLERARVDGLHRVQAWPSL